MAERSPQNMLGMHLTMAFVPPVEGAPLSDRDRAGLERLDLVVLRIANRDHHDSGTGGQSADSPARFHPAHARHVAVQQHQVYGPFGD